MKRRVLSAILAGMILAGCISGEATPPVLTDVLPNDISTEPVTSGPTTFVGLSRYDAFDRISFSNGACPMHSYTAKMEATAREATRAVFAGKYNLVSRISDAETQIHIDIADISGRITCKKSIPFHCDGSLYIEYGQRVVAPDGKETKFEGRSYSVHAGGTDHLFCSGIRIEMEKNFKSSFSRFLVDVLKHSEEALASDGKE